MTLGGGECWFDLNFKPLGQPYQHNLLLSFEHMLAKPMYAKELLSRYAAGQRDFRNLNFIGANLRNVNLSGADLSGSNFAKANLSNSNLSRANLTDAVLTGAKLVKTNLTQANLQNVDLSDVDLDQAMIRGAILPQNTQLAQSVSQS